MKYEGIELNGNGIERTELNRMRWNRIACIEKFWTANEPLGTDGRCTPQPWKLGPMAMVTPSGQHPHVTSKQATFWWLCSADLSWNMAKTFLSGCFGSWWNFSGQPAFAGSGDGVLSSAQQPYSPQWESNEDRALEIAKKYQRVSSLRITCIHGSTYKSLQTPQHHIQT